MSEMSDHIAQLKAAIAARAAADDAFRADLLADPKIAVEKALDAPLPPHVKIQVVEEAPDTYVVVVPAATATAANGELSDDELESVAGGSGKAESDAIAKRLGSAALLLAPMAPVVAVGMGAFYIGERKASKAIDIAVDDVAVAVCGVPKPPRDP